MSRSSLRYAPGLDGVRALAVLAVVAYHVGTTSDLTLLPGGYLGVDVFFVLSGYLITSLLVVEAQQHGRISIKQFYIRRARRLLPALFALLLAVAAVGAFWLPQQAARLRGDLLASLGYFQNWWLVIQSSSYFASVGDRPPLLTHLWSLAVEEQYYLVWPLILIGFALARARQATMLVVVLLGVAASFAVGQLLYHPYQDPSRVYYGTDTRALAPLLGAALAIAIRPWLHRDELPRGSRAGLDILGVTALAGLAVIAATLRDTDQPLYRGGFLVIAVLAAGLVAVAGHPASTLGRMLGRQPLRYLGERSYAIYLWHWPVCLLTRPGQDVPLTGWADVALRLALAVALAELSYQLIERPIRRHGFLAPLRRPLAPPPPPAVPASQRPLQPHPARGTARVPVKAPARPLAPVLRTALLGVALLGGGAWVSISLTAAATRPAEAAAIDLDPTTPGPSTSTATAHALVPIGAKVAFFGDSQGTSLLRDRSRPDNLDDYIHAIDATIEGCGILHGRIRTRTGEEIQLRCTAWRQMWAQRVDEYDPDLAIIMIGGWETYDLITDSNEVLTFGSPAWDNNFRRAVAEAIGILRSPQRLVAISLLPCYRLAPDVLRHETGIADARRAHINDLLRRAATTYRDGRVFTIDPPEEFCTDPIATDPEYRIDGEHFEKKGAALYFQKILPQIIDPTRRAPTTGATAPSGA